MKWVSRCRGRMSSSNGNHRWLSGLAFDGTAGAPRKPLPVQLHFCCPILQSFFSSLEAREGEKGWPSSASSRGRDGKSRLPIGTRRGPSRLLVLVADMDAMG